MGKKVKRAKQRLNRGAFVTPSPEEVEAASTSGCGWTAARLAEWGISWPPDKGWRQVLRERWYALHPDQRDPRQQTVNPADKLTWLRKLNDAPIKRDANPSGIPFCVATAMMGEGLIAPGIEHGPVSGVLARASCRVWLITKKGLRFMRQSGEV